MTKSRRVKSTKVPFVIEPVMQHDWAEGRSYISGHLTEVPPESAIGFRIFPIINAAGELRFQGSVSVERGDISKEQLQRLWSLYESVVYEACGAMLAQAMQRPEAILLALA